jgi:hypothetical protein
VPRRARPPKALLAQAAALRPPEEDEARRAQWQSFVDSTWLLGVASFDKRVAQFRRQSFAEGMSRERAAAVVRECDQRFALETAEAAATAKDSTVRVIKDAQARALQEYQSARRVVFVRGPKGATTREEVPDHRARLRALELWAELGMKLCRLLGVDEPMQVEVTHGFDEVLVRAAQETSDEEFADWRGEDKKRLPAGTVDVDPEDDGKRH